MTYASLRYNPYLKEAELTVEGEGKVSLDCFGQEGARELSEWVSEFFPDLSSHLAQKDIVLAFTGIERDLDFLTDAAERFNRNEGGNVTVKAQKIFRPNDKLDGLKNMFKRLQEESPFEELKAENIKESFERAVSNVFEMAVVATMSSGKSTLINAMLGSEILPARNEGTTAKIARIHNVDGASSFRGAAYDADNNEIAHYDPLTRDDMDSLNSNEHVSTIEIEGNIKGIKNSESMKLVLTDTPGANNSRDHTHREITYKLLGQKYKPMILYILNATQLEINDDSLLLHDVSEQMQAAGRQSRDRFLFVLNKADELDPGKGESVTKKIDDVKNYLARFGIIEPRIFPAASRLAKVIRQVQADENSITAKERKELLNNADLFLEEEAFHFSDVALRDASLLGQASRTELEEMLRDAKKRGDRYAETLVYTGIPSIELAISEYLAKYALPVRMTEGINSFLQLIRHTSAEAEAVQKIGESEKSIREAQTAIEQISALVEKGDKARDLKERIEAMSSKDELELTLRNIFLQFGEDFIRELNVNGMAGTDVPLSKARTFFNKFQEAARELSARVHAQTEKALEEIVFTQGQKCIDEYRQYVEDLLGEFKVDTLSSPASLLGSLAGLSLNDVLYDYTRNVEIKVGEHEEYVGTRRIKNPEREGWRIILIWKPWEVDQKVYKRVDDYELQELVNFKEYLDEQVLPLVEEFGMENKKRLMANAKEYENGLKDAFLNKFEQLDGKIREKLEEKSAMLSRLEHDKAELEESREKLEWYRQYMSDLQNLLENEGE